MATSDMQFKDNIMHAWLPWVAKTGMGQWGIHCKVNFKRSSYLRLISNFYRFTSILLFDAFYIAL
jgi:hypothetical protein